MKRLILLVALVMAMAVLAPAAFADNDTDEVEGADVEMEAKEPSDAQLRKAQMIADYFVELFKTDDLEENTAQAYSIRTDEDGQFGHAIGWGVMYKVMVCVGDGPASFDPAHFENGWAVGQLCKDYAGDDDTPKNFGQLQKESRPHKPAKDVPPGQLKRADKKGS